MLGSEDEFGFDDDDEDMLLAVAAAGLDTVASKLARPEHRPSKRRRIAKHSGSDSDAAAANRNDSIGATQDSTTESGISTSQTAPKDDEEEKVASPKPKSKYRIHIPKQTGIPEDTFFTQAPPASQSPYRIRGPQWQKQKPPSPTAELPPPLPKATPLHKNLKGFDGTHLSADSVGVVPVVSGQEDAFDYAGELANLPSDAFSSPVSPSTNAEDAIEISSQQEYGGQWGTQSRSMQQSRAPQNSLRQTTLFGTQIRAPQQQTQSMKQQNWPMANKVEPPTHHKLNEVAMQTWVYPTNLGTIRSYQYSIVAHALYHNLLVALPTGLGKTFIAATVMLNWYRWTQDAQIVFVAPTKPLVSQQVDACFKIVGIPRSDTTMLTGGIPPGLRAEEWNKKRVFFMTPQTIINDLKTGICDPKRIVLLVVDEAHRATGAYAYVEVVKFLRRFNTSFRVLALTATPGSSVESVQEVIDGLGIARTEIRTEESIDIRDYVHTRSIETTIFENSEEMVMIMDLFSNALQPILRKLNGMNAYWLKDPMSLTAYGCTQARSQWMASNAGRKANMGIKGMVNSIFNVLASQAHSIELLKYHGIGPFYHRLVLLRKETQEAGNKGSKYKREIIENESFKKMMTRLQGWINDRNFVGHPKLDFVRDIALNHFLDAGEGRGVGQDQISPASTRIMIFVHYRDSAEEAVRVLKRNEPMIRPHVFVGQAASQGSEGMDQKKQLDVIEKFKSGIYNTLVATSIGEEGLDIGEVDLIICYDASASPIRMLQRMGRTGRKRAGRIEVLLMKGKEENNFVKAKDNYLKMQEMIAAGTRFHYHDALSPRIIPKSIQPVVDKRVIEIPPENSQLDLPEPKRRGRAPKAPPKKFHLPDNARLGFTNASRLGGNEGVHASEISAERAKTKQPKQQQRQRVRSSSAEPVVPIESVFLTPREEQDLERTYLHVSGPEHQTVEAPRSNAFPSLQRRLRPTDRVAHGRATRRFVDLMARIHDVAAGRLSDYEDNLEQNDKEIVEKHILERYQPRQANPDKSRKRPATEYSSHQASSSQAIQSSGRGVDIGMSETENEDNDINDLDDDDVLQDFIEDDERASGSRAVSSISSSPLFAVTKKNASTARGSVDLTGTEDSDDEIESLSQLLGAPKAKAPEPFQGRGNRRNVVIDSDSDE